MTFTKRTNLVILTNLYSLPTLVTLSRLLTLLVFCEPPNNTMRCSNGNMEIKSIENQPLR